MIPRHVPLVETTRGGTTECVHYGSVAVVDAQGKLVASAGDPDSLNFTSSALKPLQALRSLRRAAGALRLRVARAGLMCASHSGEAMHVSVVQRILARVGLDEKALQCGCHTPSYFAATETASPVGTTWSALHHNCSGKHAGFLAYCRMHSLQTENYLDTGHPCSKALHRRGALDRATRLRWASRRSAPNYAMPLKRLRSFLQNSRRKPTECRRSIA